MLLSEVLDQVAFLIILGSAVNYAHERKLFAEKGQQLGPDARAVLCQLEHAAPAARLALVLAGCQAGGQEGGLRAHCFAVVPV